jgi:hypothetical protein
MQVGQSLPLESEPKRRAADLRRPIHHHEGGAFRVRHETLGYNLRHDPVGVVDALAPRKRWA